MEYVLNEQQSFVVDQVEKWFKDSSYQTLNITGGAGTGKSYLLGAILERLRLKSDEILPMAYTGQACSVMRKKGMVSACTCHSGLFTPVKVPEIDINGNIKINQSLNIPILKWKFIPKDFRNSNIKLIILDEAWMIPKRFKRYIDATGIKVIATGDPEQLPPIADEPAYLLDKPLYHLTELMRQVKDSPIVYLADRAKRGLPIQPGLYGDSALVIFEDELNNNILSKANIVLCGKNLTREKMNNRIRNNILNLHVDYPMFGERLICRKNNWDKNVNNIPLVNGLIGTVISPPDIGTFSEGLLSVDFLPDVLDVPFMDLKINHKYLNSDLKERDKLKLNPFIQGELFEYAYSSTTHLAQGSEYNCGVYIEEYIGNGIQNALNYTGITRFKQRVVYVKHKPKFWNF